jgi:hypothetical protein
LVNWKLKAQIVRINHGAKLIPKGIMQVQMEEMEDTGDKTSQQTLEDQEVVPVEEVQTHTIDFYQNKKNWVHAEQSN